MCTCLLLAAVDKPAAWASAREKRHTIKTDSFGLRGWPPLQWWRSVCVKEMLVFSSSGMKANLSCQPVLFIFTRAFFSISTVTWPARVWIAWQYIGGNSASAPTVRRQQWTQDFSFTINEFIISSVRPWIRVWISQRRLTCQRLGSLTKWLQASKDQRNYATSGRSFTVTLSPSGITGRSRGEWRRSLYQLGERVWYYNIPSLSSLMMSQRLPQTE